MSGQATGWVLRHGPKDRAQRAVLLTIADASNRDGENARPGMQAMVEGSLYSEGHVRRIISQLVEDGWIEVTDPRGPGRSVEYRLPGVAGEGSVTAHSARLSGPQSEGKPRINRAKSAHLDARLSEPDTSLLNYGNGNLTSLVSDDVGCQPAQPMDPLHGFQAFWDQYPRRNGKKLGRAVCERLWAKLPLEDRRAAWRGARHYAGAVDGGLTLAKDPERFLKHRVWEDWQEPATPDRLNGDRRDSDDGEYHGVDVTRLYGAQVK